LTAAAGVAAAHQLGQQQQQQQEWAHQPPADGDAYAAEVAQLQQYIPEYHVVHMPSPRLGGEQR
jgi:hypothetical protein